MKKKHIIWILIILLFIFLIGIGIKICIDNNHDILNNELNTEGDIERAPDVPQEPTIEQKVNTQMESMTLRDKIGQMIFIAYRKAEYDDKLNDILTQVKPGGFILFSENITTYEETTNYITKLKSTATIPMFISIDQEGGRVQRIKQLSDANVLTIPSMYELGKTGDTQLAYDVGSVMAEELSAFGINMDFAPTLDVFSNPNNTVIGQRAFGNDAQTVINMALPFARGMSESGIIPVYKHFPGHGDTDADSHVELPVVSKTKEELYQNELLTFKAAIENGAQMIMTAHIALPNVTGNYVPSTLSSEVINGILRGELGFDGVVITDAVEMKALADNYTLEQICNYSINAGVDIILMPQDPIAAVNTIEQLVQNGTITEERINESVKRILTMKYNNLYEEKELNKDNIGTQEHIDIIKKI